MHATASDSAPVRSMVGLIPLFAVEVLDEDHIENLPASRSA
jgi:hypothetical protein